MSRKATCPPGAPTPESRRSTFERQGHSSISLGIVPVSLALALALTTAACSATGKTHEQAEAPPSAVAITTATATEQAITRTLRVTGTLNADEQAEVSAETAGRVVATPVERGTRVAAGDTLVRLARVETEAQAAEAEANAAQIAARLNLSGNGALDIEKVPDVANAKATLALAESEFKRIETLREQNVVSQSEFDQRRTQVEAARQQYESARNAAQQQFQSLQAARARVTLAHKSLADTTVRAPFSGLVGERRVSIGDYVTRGAVVATVVRNNPLRVELTVPEQALSQIRVGAPVSFRVDAFPDRRFDGKIRFVSPSLKPDQRALTVEAVVPNPTGELKPGLFATAEVEQAAPVLGIMVPSSAIQGSGGTSRVYVVKGDRAEERLVTVGQTVGDQTEIVRGVASGETVAASGVGGLRDGVLVRVGAVPAATARPSSK
jgi:RND family efflux transporter MFP subunit